MEDKYGLNGGKQPYAEIGGILPRDAHLGGSGAKYSVSGDLRALSPEAKKLLISLGMIPGDAGVLIWLGLKKKETIDKIDNSGDETPVYQIKITEPFLRKHYGE